MPSIDCTLQHLLGSIGEKFSSSLLLAQRIEFIEPKQKDNYMEQLRLKYNPINSVETCSHSATPKLKSPEMYSKEKVELEWLVKKGIGCGLVNPANTCYLNSTLQCLLYTPPLINYVLADHKKHCRLNGFCVCCSLKELYNAVHSNNSICRPSSFIHHLKMIAKHFCYGRQEDAHEFLVHLRDKMIQQFLISHPKINNNQKDTTPAHAIFGGKLVSTLTCSQCHYQSNTIECFLGLSLEVRQCDTIQQSLNRMCKKETLSGANSYKCEKCKRNVIATKQFKIDHTPNVLVLHLKRFQFGGFIGKLKNQIQFPERLDLSNWTKHQNSQDTIYKLYAVLVHAGSSAQCGHYYCYVKSSSGAWHCMNDTSVSTVSLNRVLQSQAYLLFYSRCKAGKHTFNGEPSSISRPKTNVECPIGNSQSSKMKLMDKNPFFDNSHTPIKFNLSLNSPKDKQLQPSKSPCNPYLDKVKHTDKKYSKTFIGPVLPPNYKKKNTVQASSNECKSMSSLDMIKSSYDGDDSDYGSFKVNAQPVLSVKRKELAKQNMNVFERLGHENRKSTTQTTKVTNGKSDVFERLGEQSTVKNWNGEKSSNFNNWDNICNPYKRERDDYEKELDEGKVKKLKKRNHEESHGKNRHSFQKAFENQKHNSRPSWDSNHNSKPKKFHRKPFWKDKKCSS